MLPIRVPILIIVFLSVLAAATSVHIDTIDKTVLLQKNVSDVYVTNVGLVSDTALPAIQDERV